MKNVQEECQYFLTCYNPNIIMSGVVIVLTFRNNLYILSCMNSKPTELGKFKLMCCSRKYPHPSHGRFLSLNIHPPENSGLATYFLLKRLEFPLTFPGTVGMDVFWKYTICTCEVSTIYMIVNKLILNILKGLRCPNYLLCILPIIGRG